MFVKTAILTALIFSVVYPLCFWTGCKIPPANNSRKWHLGVPNFIGGITLLCLLMMKIPLMVKIGVLAWKIIFVSISIYSWKKAYLNPSLMTIPVVAGIYIFIKVQNALINSNHMITFISVAAGFMFCYCVFSIIEMKLR